MPSATKTLAAALVSAVGVLSHGHINNIVINGASYPGYDVFSLPWQPEHAPVVGWSTEATNDGFISPSQYGSPDIICHKNAKNAGGHARVAAGDSIYLQYNTWPEGHKGPVLDYLASCGDEGCETISKESLEFFKIAEKGMKSGTTVVGTGGEFATDEVIPNGNGWMVKIPENIKAGFYVLRHEFIALHSAHQPDGAQNYPQCFNLEITGSGSDLPDGVKGTALYKASDPGVDINIYNDFGPDYVIPGPKLIKGGGSVEQHTSAIASSATPITDNQLAQPTGGPVATGKTSVQVPVPTTTLATRPVKTTAIPAIPTVTDEAGPVYSGPINNYPQIPEVTTTATATATEAAVPDATQPGQDPAQTTAPHTCKKSSRRRRRHARRHAH